MRVIQMLDALDFGDGVSNDVIHLHELLDELGIANRIYSKWWNERVRSYTTSIDEYCYQPGDCIIYHFSGKSHILEQAVSYPCRRMVRYHNVTPPEFFLPDNPDAATSCREGLAQIQRSIARFDGALADSPFNASDLISYGADASRVKVLPIVFDFDKYRSTKTVPELARKLSSAPYFIYIGRMAPNKCIEDVLAAFEYYYRFHDSSACLYLVGNTEHSPAYMERLMQQHARMSAKDHAVFTGKVSEEELLAYYRGAAASLCMSEHEGFCMPLLEAASFDVPVIAYDSCAVPYTMGDSGILLRKKDPSLTAHLMDEVAHDQGLRWSIIEKQRENLEKYSRESIKMQLQTLLREWEEQ